MKRTVLTCLMTAVLLSPMSVPTKALGGDALLDAIPADAWGMVAVRNLNEFNGKIMSLQQAVNSPMAGMSPLMMAKGMLGLMNGLNDDGGVAFVVLPLSSPEEFEQRAGIFVPVTDYTALLSMMQPEDAGDGVSKVLLQGNESYAVQKGGFAVLCPSIEAAKAFATAQTGAAGKLSEHQVQRFGKDDLTIWVNVAAAAQSELVAGLLAQAQAQGMGSLSDWIGAMKSVQVSVRLGNNSVNLGFYADAKPGTPLAKAMAATKPPTQSLLTGLPAEGYVVAAGNAMGSGGSELAVQHIDQAMATIKQQAPPEMLEICNTCAEVARKLVPQIRSGAFALHALSSEGGNGLAAATMVLGVDGDAAEFVATVGNAIGDVLANVPEEQAEMVNAMVSYQAKAEGDNCGHLRIDPMATGANEEDVAMLKKVLGQDGLLIRLASVGTKHVVISLGGGAAQLATVSKLIEGGQAPLAADPSIKALAETMSPSRVSEGYISAGNLMAGLKAIGQAVGEPMEIPLGPVETPLSWSGYVTADGGNQSDLVIPMELIKAAAQAAMAGMGGGPGAGGPGDPGGAPTE